MTPVNWSWFSWGKDGSIWKPISVTSEDLLNGFSEYFICLWVNMDTISIMRTKYYRQEKLKVPRVFQSSYEVSNREVLFLTTYRWKFGKIYGTSRASEEDIERVGPGVDLVECSFAVTSRCKRAAVYWKVRWRKMIQGFLNNEMAIVSSWRWKKEVKVLKILNTKLRLNQSRIFKASTYLLRILSGVVKYRTRTSPIPIKPSRTKTPMFVRLSCGNKIWSCKKSSYF